MKQRQKLQLEHQSVVQLSNAFTQEELHRQWQFYAKHQEQKGEHIIASILLSHLPVLLQDGQTLLVTLANESSKLDLQQASKPLLKFLHQQLSNTNISIDYKVDQQSVKRKVVYTPQEKLARMIEINPDLAIFQKRLNLTL